MNISGLHQAYLDAKIDYHTLEQKIRICQDTRLLPGLNAQLEDLAIAVEQKFWAWSDEVDSILKTPVELPQYFTPPLKPTYVGIWHEDYADSTPGAA